MKEHHWKVIPLAVAVAVALILASCATPTPETVEVETVVTQVVKETIETVVTATPEPEAVEEPLPDTPAGEYQNAGRHETVIFDVSVTHADPANWNPFIFDDLRDIGLQQAMIEPLFILNYETGEIESWLGLSMEPNETFDVWTLKLREGIKWSDGEDFDADDVVFTTEMFMANTPDIGADMAKWTASVEKVDGLTVQFNLTGPNPRYQLDNWTVKIWGDRNSIVPEHIWKDYADAPLEFTNYDPDKGWPVFTGPYLVSSFTENEFIYVRNDDWWGVAAGFQDLPAPKRLIWIHYGTEETRAAAMSNNDLDAMANTTKGAFEAIQIRNPNVIAWTDGLPLATMDPCPRYLAINTEHPMWSDANLRKAVSLAIDRDQIVTIAYEGTSSASKTQFPQYGAMDQYISALEEAGLTASSTADPEAAKALIEASGWTLNDKGWYEKDGQVLTIEILTIEEFNEIRRIGDIVSEQLRKVGIDSQTRVLSFFPWLEAMGESGVPEDDYQGSISFLCGGVNEPYASMVSLHGGEGAEKGGTERWSGPNWEGYRAAVDQLDGLAPGDPAGVPLVVEAYQYLMEDMPSVPLTQASQLIPLNTTYWVNWPTAANPYTSPATWVQNAHLIIHNLQPAK
ncbi:MAG: ABC transporter substrate-binding protein [Chloroflexota bacterium]|nr:ABC transporter substrate-binding protein [Chloroflexota bacterium]